MAHVCHNGDMKTLSKAQTEILRALDGATAPVEFSGTRARTLKSLKDMGLVSFVRWNKPSPTYYYPGGTTLVLTTQLTMKGAEWVYNGGLDVPQPKF